RPTPAGGSKSTRASTRRPSPAATSARATGGRDAETGLSVVALSDLPREAQATVALIDAGGPFPFSQDGVTFGNYEKVLPAHPRGWYREYTVRTPGQGDRGPRRIVTGDSDRELFYTADHYASFARVSR
ncbi:MAG TPA: ribonuclease domain-containing protein, partial [Friedmanniella sp.]